MGNYLSNNPNQQAQRRPVNQILDGPYTDNMGANNGNLTQKGYSNSKDLIEDYSSFDINNQVAFANLNQQELGGTQKLANLNRYLAEENGSGRGGAAMTYAMGGMGNTTASLMLKSASDQQ